MNPDTFEHPSIKIYDYWVQNGAWMYISSANILKPEVDSPLRADSPSINYAHYTGLCHPHFK